MAKQDLNIGLAANDGTGDKLRTGGRKIKANFDELYNKLVPAILVASIAAELGAYVGGMAKGDPGANAMAVSAFEAAGGLNIPVGTDAVRTSSHYILSPDIGGAFYTYDAAVDGAYVAANPHSSFVSSNGRGFRLAEAFPTAHQLGCKGDGITDDDAAANAAINAFPNVHFPDGTYVITTLSLPEGCVISSAGKGTRFLQKPGTPANTRIISIAQSDIVFCLNGVTIEGQLDQAGDTGDDSEQNAAAIVKGAGTIRNIVIGDITGINIRGDVLYVGAGVGFSTEAVRVGNVYGNNIFRNVVTLAGGVNGCQIASIDGEQVGFNHLDAEPNAGENPNRGVVIGRCRGRNVQLVGTDSGCYLDGIVINELVSDSTIATCSPDYALANPGILTFTRPYALQTRNLKLATINSWKASGYDGAALNCVYNPGELNLQAIRFGRIELSDNCKTTGTSYLVGIKNHVFISWDHCEVTITNTAHSLMFAWACLGGIGEILATMPNTPAAGASIFSFCDDISKAGPVYQVGGTGGSMISGSSNRIMVDGGKWVGDRVISNSNGCLVENAPLTPVTGEVVGTCANNRFKGCTHAGTFLLERFYPGSSVGYQVDANGAIDNSGTAGNGINIGGSGALKSGGNVIVKARQTGWAQDTGTAKKTANVTYAKGAALTVGSAYSQAEVTAIKDRLALVEQALQDWSQKQKAIVDVIHLSGGQHGLIGT